MSANPKKELVHSPGTKLVTMESIQIFGGPIIPVGSIVEAVDNQDLPGFFVKSPLHPEPFHIYLNRVEPL